ncbi:MAG: YidC/Oxa1 family membrane protein insertase [Ruminococcus sp.]
MNNLYDIIGVPFGYLMSWIYDFVGNYGVAIILFTIVTKLLLFPVNYHTQKSSARMLLLNPKLEKLRKSYANNPTKLSEEQQKLYQQEGINPMGSCLPSFIQMFLLFGVLDVVYKPLTHILHFSKEVRNSAIEIASKLSVAAGGKEIRNNDLRNELMAMEQLNKAPDKFNDLGENFRELVSEFSENFTFFGINLGKTPDVSPEIWNKESFFLFLIPILAGAAQLVHTIYLQMYQKKTRQEMPNMGCMNIMMYLMPLMSIWFAYQVPAGVGFYWICSSLFTFLITLGLNHYFTPERTAVINEKEKVKAKKKADKHPERKTFMQKMLEQQQALEAEQSRINGEGNKISRSELNKYNRDRINEGRKRMAEKYGDEYDDKIDE